MGNYPSYYNDYRNVPDYASSYRAQSGLYGGRSASPIYVDTPSPTYDYMTSSTSHSSMGVVPPTSAPQTATTRPSPPYPGPNMPPGLISALTSPGRPVSNQMRHPLPLSAPQHPYSVESMATPLYERTSPGGDSPADSMSGDAGVSFPGYDTGSLSSFSNASPSTMNHFSRSSELYTPNDSGNSSINSGPDTPSMAPALPITIPSMSYRYYDTTYRGDMPTSMPMPGIQNYLSGTAHSASYMMRNEVTTSVEDVDNTSEDTKESKDFAHQRQ